MGAERTPSYCGNRNGTPHRSAIVTAVSQPHEKVLGTIALLAPANTAAEKHYFALEHAALALSANWPISMLSPKSSSGYAGISSMICSAAPMRRAHVSGRSPSVTT
jgi:hypothetical protein